MTSPSSAGRDGASAAAASPGLACPDRSLRRRLSVEEDDFYDEVMTAEPRPPNEQPPPYVPFARPRTASPGADSGAVAEDVLPRYSTDIELQAVWETKMEIEDTNKRAPNRQWGTALIELRGTSLKLYGVKKEWAQWGWGVTRDWVTTMSPDHPPWVHRDNLIRAYTLQHADVGIAADYKKRRNVIRLRVETDQLLIACVESITFVTWLDALFSAIAISEPIDERELPSDQSIPRGQRSRLLSTQTSLPARLNYPIPTPRPLSQLRISMTDDGERSRTSLRDYSPSLASSMSLTLDVDTDADPWPSPEALTPGRTQTPPLQLGSPIGAPSSATGAAAASIQGRLPSDRPPTRRSATSISNSSYRHLAAAASMTDLSRSRLNASGKWNPRHEIWTPDDDIRYARLCYSVLLFQSPRKSEYVVRRGTRWFVDWETGRMVRVLPPRYGEFDNDGRGRRQSHQSFQATTPRI